MAVGKKIGAVAWEEGVECRFELFEEGVEGSCGGCAEVSFEFGKSQFDGIEVRAVGRQMQEFGSAAFYSRSDGRTFVRGKIVGDDDITGTQRGCQALLEVSQEGGAIHGTVQQPGRREAIMAQRGNEGESLPVAVRHLLHATLGAGRASIVGRHFRV